MRFFKFLLLALAAVASIAGCSSDVAMIGLDADGQTQAFGAPEDLYIDVVSGTINSTQNKMLPFIGKKADESGPKLRSVMAGLDISGTTKVGDVNLTGRSGITLIFTKKE